tara:strand:+ start:414 stop:1061 length:648 start_codon:yes stop_codon:yes gene_type:complete
MIVILPMLFIMVEILSILFGHTFTTINLFGIEFHFIIGVIYFCLGFYILDIITEIYNDKLSDKIIYGKILCQTLFVLLVQFGIHLNHDANQAAILQSMDFMPRMILAGMIASLVGYKLTSIIMQYLKIRYEGRFITVRYLASTLPGEFVFSFIYSFIFLYNEYSFEEYIKIFYSLAAAKIIFSLAFATIFKPATKIITFMVKSTSIKNATYARIK